MKPFSVSQSLRKIVVGTALLGLVLAAAAPAAASTATCGADDADGGRYGCEAGGLRVGEECSRSPTPACVAVTSLVASGGGSVAMLGEPYCEEPEREGEEPRCGHSLGGGTGDGPAQGIEIRIRGGCCPWWVEVTIILTS